MVQHAGEAIVLRTWPFLEADLIVSLLTRDHGRIKGVARHAMKSRRRFGGALEPMTYVRARWAEKPKQDLVRLDAFEIVSSPLTQPMDYGRLAALALLAEVIEHALPEGASDDAVFRLTIATLAEIQPGRIWLPVTYFCLWMNRLLGWMPELGHCAVCGLDLAGRPAYYTAQHPGVTCPDDRPNGSLLLSAGSVIDALRMLRTPVAQMAAEDWPSGRAADLRRFAMDTLEWHLERKLLSARALGRL